MRKLSFLIFITFLTRTAFSQCCSPGNPIGGTTNIGILDKKTFRLIAFYRYSYSDGYYKGSKKSNSSFVKDAKFNYAGLVLSYGLLNKLTIETELGYFINKSQTYNVDPLYTNTGYGLNNGVFSLKYNLISKKEKPLEWTIGVGVKFPFIKKYQIVNNVELPRDVQPSTNAFGIVAQSFLYKGIPEKKMKLFFINRFETNYPDYKYFKYGNFLSSSLFLTKSLGNSDFTAIIQVRHEYRGKDLTNANVQSPFANGDIVKASGGNLIFIAPQINYTFAKKWNLSLLADIPVYRYYNETQLGNKFSVALYLSRDFGGKCEKKE